MLTLLEGQISFAGGLHDALEAITRHKNVQNGVLRITSDHASGLIGIFCGRYITGAVLTLTGERKHAAVKKLLSAKDGTFAFMDTMGESIPDLKQAMAIDIRLLLDSVQDFANEDIPISDDTLTGLSADEEISLIDTQVEEEKLVSALDEKERIARINSTYSKLVSLSEHEKQRMAEAGGEGEEGWLPSMTEEEKAALLQRHAPIAVAEDYSATAAQSEDEQQQTYNQIPAFAAQPPKVPKGNFTKLNHWSLKGDLYMAIFFWCFFLAAAAGVYYFYGKQIMALFHK